jgi:hypothetical protein
LNPKIPTCVQLEEIKENQLTVDQTNESRLVTKVSLKPSKKLLTYFFFKVPFYN